MLQPQAPSPSLSLSPSSSPKPKAQATHQPAAQPLTVGCWLTFNRHTLANIHFALVNTLPSLLRFLHLCCRKRRRLVCRKVHSLSRANLPRRKHPRDHSIKPSHLISSLDRRRFGSHSSSHQSYSDLLPLVRFIASIRTTLLSPPRPILTAHTSSYLLLGKHLADLRPYT